MTILVLSLILWCIGCLCLGYFIYCILSTKWIKPTYTALDYIPRRYTQEDFDKFAKEMDKCCKYCVDLGLNKNSVRKCKYKRKGTQT